MTGNHKEWNITVKSSMKEELRVSMLKKSHNNLERHKSIRNSPIQWNTCYMHRIRNWSKIVQNIMARDGAHIMDPNTAGKQTSYDTKINSINDISCTGKVGGALSKWLTGIYEMCVPIQVKKVPVWTRGEIRWQTISHNTTYVQNIVKWLQYAQIQ